MVDTRYRAASSSLRGRLWQLAAEQSHVISVRLSADGLQGRRGAR